MQYSNLKREAAYINGAWVTADDGAVMAVINPADGKLIANVPDLGVASARAAIDAANVAFTSWKHTTARARAELLRRWHDLIVEHADQLARLLTLEQGKPLREAKGEVLSAASFFEWYAEEAKRTYGENIPSNSRRTRLLTIKQPIGVVAAITPWNFPISMIARKAAPAIAAGCTIVIKPAEDTPLCALALAALAEDAGIPAGVINVVTTARPVEVGRELCTHPVVRKVSFTGSTPVGKVILSLAAQTVKKASMELGGNAPFIVFDDADLESAVAGALVSKYRNAGQTCICTNRIYVQSGLYERFVARYQQEVEKLRLGAGSDDSTDIGPLINDAAVAKIDGLVRRALEQGAVLNSGGYPVSQGQRFYQPTLLTEVDESMEIAHAELFGPVSTVFRFDSEEEVIARANATPYGLAAYVYSRDIGRVWRVSEGLEFGMVGVNEGMISNELTPFGGVKESGLGREGSRHGIDDYLELKYICMGGI
uniref:NAD-dependent succinate-semialdehyde dehydrogenase n=1 Tax=Marinobacterium profundum TaxID=1714300 RepID=UPI0009E83F61|nr:NAD-dependent succinate-semialdehyde dehydrogenase [Marinobacterium profundum]